MTELSVFNFDDNEVRVVTIDGEPWWVAKDVCDAVGITNVSDATSRLDQADVDSIDIRSGGQNRKMNVVSESGLYELIIRSDKPDAREFRRWITKEVLPSIRKTGSYALTPLTLPEALRAYADEVEAKEAVQRELEAAQPKVAVYNEWLTSDAIEMTDYAKRIKFTPVTKFTKTLRELSILRKDRREGSSGGFRNLPTKKWEHAFEVHPTQIHTGEWIDVARVNTEGQLEILEALRDNGYDV